MVKRKKLTPEMEESAKLLAEEFIAAIQKRFPAALDGADLETFDKNENSADCYDFARRLAFDAIPFDAA